MRRLLHALALMFVLTGPAAAEIRAFDLPTIEALGREIYRQDSAAWVATDALQAKVKDLAAEHLKGWIVVPNGAGRKVRFLRDTGQGVEAGYDVDVDLDLKTRLYAPADRTLTADEKAAFLARQTASADLKERCREGYNTAVIRDPEGDGWLVWLLAPMPKLGAMPMGGHHRYTISRDGRTIQRRDALSKSCALIAPADRAGATAMVATHLVSPTPVETHVFLQLQSGTPLYIVTGETMWKIDHGHVVRSTRPERTAEPSA